MTVRERIDQQNLLSSEFDHAIDGSSISGGTDAVIAGALLDQAQEHCMSIVRLIESDRHGSAFALARVAFETAVRGIWILRCASPQEVGAFQSEKLSKQFGTIVSEVESFYGATGGILSHVKSSYWSPMCSYTHGGHLQATRRIGGDQVLPRYSEAEKEEVLRFSEFCYYLSAIEIWQLVGNHQMAAEWLSKFQNRK